MSRSRRFRVGGLGGDPSCVLRVEGFAGCLGRLVRGGQPREFKSHFGENKVHETIFQT